MSRVISVLGIGWSLLLAGCLSFSASPDRSDLAQLTDEIFTQKIAELMRASDYESVIELARAYRTLKQGQGSIGELALLMEADAERLSGNPDQAWALFQKASPDPYPAPWTRTGVDILYDLGRKDEAYDFCARNIPRVPHYPLQQSLRQFCIRRSME